LSIVISFSQLLSEKAHRFYFNQTNMGHWNLPRDGLCVVEYTFAAIPKEPQI
jgi:hypothetical protein